MKWLDNVSFMLLIIISIAMAVAPLNGPSHLLEKLSMLANQSLVKPIDIFDLFMHATPIVILLLKAVREYKIKFK